MMRHINLKNPIIWILLVSPLFLWGIILLLPTFDDWTYFTTPFYEFGNDFINRLLPRYSYWRPWDCLFGYILSLKPTLFPTLNHIAIYLGHIGCCICVYKIGKLLKFKNIACNISTLFFFISPAMLGTVLGIDSLNQTYSQFWGLLATWFYLRKRDSLHTILWLLSTIIATFAKENGITFFIIPQIIAWGFNIITFRQAVKDTIFAIICIAIYFLARISLNNPDVYINEEYFENTLSRKLKNVGVFIGMTWIPLDYVSLVYKPCRDLTIVAITLIVGMSFIMYLFFKQRKYIIGKPAICIIICSLAATSPHLTTLFTSMHSYAGLGMASLLVAHLVNKYNGNNKVLIILFAMYLINCLFVDYHHWIKAYHSGITGENMALKVIKEAKSCPKNVYMIYLDQNEKKYSMFCVIPYDAFGWGCSVQFKTNQKWPIDIKYKYIFNNKPETLQSCLSDAKDYEGVWYIHRDTIEILK
ncbi:MAG: hypothetical protein ACI4V5_03225 [Prevotella sp.]